MKRAQLGASKSHKSNKRTRHTARKGSQAVRLKSTSVDRIKECRTGWSPNEGHVVKSRLETCLKRLI